MHTHVFQWANTVINVKTLINTMFQQFFTLCRTVISYTSEPRQKLCFAASLPACRARCIWAQKLALLRILCVCLRLHSAVSDFSTSRIWRQSYGPPANTSMHTHFKWHLYACLAYPLAQSYTVTHTHLSDIHISSHNTFQVTYVCMCALVSLFRRIYNACVHTQTRWWISGFVPYISPVFPSSTLASAGPRCALFPTANTCWPPCFYPVAPLSHGFTEPSASRRAITKSLCPHPFFFPFLYLRPLFLETQLVNLNPSID